MRVDRTTLALFGTWILVSSCAAPTGGGALTAVYPAGECTSCAEWNEPQEPFRIHGNSYYVGTAGLASVLITSPEGHVLIDAGLPASAPLILANIRTLGFDPADVRLILNTHAHFDHAGGLAALQRATGARVAASEPSAPVLRRGRSGPEDPQFGLLLDYPAVRSVQTFADGETLRVGPLAVTGYLTEGHTPGGTSWTWRSCDGTDCLDLVFADSQTAISADGYRFTDRAPLEQFERGYARIESLPCDVLITPHPAASALWERRASAAGLVDPTACRRYAGAARESLRRRLATEAATP